MSSQDFVAEDENKYNPFVPTPALESLRKIKKYMPGLAKGIYFTLLLALVGSLGRLAIPMLVQQVTDLVVQDPIDLHRIFVTLGLGALLIGIGSFSQVLTIRRLGVAAEVGLAQARSTGIKKLHSFSLDQQHKGPRGQLIARLTNDIDDMTAFMRFGFIDLAISMLQLVIVCIVMIAWTWQLSLVVAILTVFYGIGAIKVQKKIAPAFVDSRERGGDMQAILAETIMGAEVIEAYNIETRTKKRVENAIDSTAKAESVGGFWASLYSGISSVFDMSMTISTMIVGLFLVVNGQLSVGTVLAFWFLLNLYSQPLLYLGEALGEAQIAVACWSRVCGLLETEAEILDPAFYRDDLQEIPAGPIGLELNQVTMVYPGNVAPSLVIPKLTVPAGQQVAVVGETGSGKSTLSKVITRLYEPTAGTIFVGGVNLAVVGEENLRSRMLMVPQEDVLLSSTLRDNLLLAYPNASDKMLLDGIADLDLSDWLTTLPNGLDTNMGERGSALSAGQRQLVGLIRAHMADPSILVLDEATSALDPFTEQLVRRAMKALTKGRTTITIAHRLSTAAEADRVLVFDNGRIVEDAPHKALITHPNGRYAQLWEAWEAGTSV